MERYWNLLVELYQEYRTLLGTGFERSLDRIEQLIPLSRRISVASGSTVGSWTVPQQWDVAEAWIANEEGEILLDFKEYPHCLWQYSSATDEWITHDDLMARVAIGPNTNIPLVVTYYKERWGFSVSEELLPKFNSKSYHVVVKSSFSKGSLTIGEIVLPGSSPDEILIDGVLSCCSLANNLTGPVAAVYMAEKIKERSNRHFTYRILLTPETIGPIAFHHAVGNNERVVGGLNLINLGDTQPWQYKRSRANTLVDQAVAHVLKNRNAQSLIKEYDVRTGSCGNEKAYNSLGIEIPIGALRRSELCSYPEYDTSGDDLSFISRQSLNESFSLLDEIIVAIEANIRYIHQFEGEPFLTGYGLFPKIASDEDRIPYDYLMGFTDGKHSIIDLVEMSGLSLKHFEEPVRLMREKHLIKGADAIS